MTSDAICDQLVPRPSPPRTRAPLGIRFLSGLLALVAFTGAARGADRDPVRALDRRLTAPDNVDRVDVSARVRCSQPACEPAIVLDHERGLTDRLALRLLGLRYQLVGDGEDVVQLAPCSVGWTPTPIFA